MKVRVQVPKVHIKSRCCCTLLEGGRGGEIAGVFWPSSQLDSHEFWVSEKKSQGNRQRMVEQDIR